MEKEYISIKEFASRVGVSQQAIYKQLNNKLKKHLTEVEGKKMLDISALKIFEKKQNESKVEQQLNNKLLDMLQAELEAKDKQIAELQKLLDQEQQLRMVEHKRVLELEQKEQEAAKEQNGIFWRRFLWK